MHPSENKLEEDRSLRRAMRDLVALSTLPAVWTGLGPDGIARSLADVLLETLRLDFVCVRLTGSAKQGMIEVVRSKYAADQIAALRSSLASLLKTGPLQLPATLPDPLGDGTLHLAVTGLGLSGDCGVVITGSCNPEFPTEQDRLLLGVGANQAAIVVQRRRAEEQVHEQRDRLRVTLASIGDAVITTDTEGRFTFLNGVAESLTGWTNAEASGQPLDAVFRLVNEDTRQPVENPALRSLREGVVVGSANHPVLIRKDGTERPIEDSAAPVRDGQGQIVGCVLVFRDVTERRRAENEARRNNELFRLVHQIGKIGHWEWNSLTDENKWSPEIQALYGLEPGTFEGTYEAWARLVHPDDLPRAEEDMRRALETGKFFTEFRVVWPDGSVHWLEARANVFKDGHDRPVRILGVNMDITEHKHHEEALREADRRKDEFLAMLAHELRNPLAPIRNALHVVLTRGQERRQAVRQAWGMIERQVENLVRLVDDLLDVSRISRGKINLHKEPVDVATLVARAVEGSRPLIEARRHDLKVALPDEPMWVEADPTRMAQVLWNLLNNAAKYTPDGGRIGLTAAQEGGEAVIRVRDTGMGIPPEMLPRMFDLFTQAERTLDRAEGGLGIGLTLVRRLTEMHNGVVEAFSAGPGEGSEFVVRLPLLPDGSPAAAAHESDSGKRARAAVTHRILVVDDNRDSADSLAMLLRLVGHDVRTVHDGRQALVVAATYRPDLVLLDIGLPGMDGFAVARHLRSQPELAGVVLVALTGYGSDEDRRQTQAAGFNHHMVKPVHFDALQELLSTLEPHDARRP